MSTGGKGKGGGGKAKTSSEAKVLSTRSSKAGLQVCSYQIHAPVICIKTDIVTSSLSDVSIGQSLLLYDTGCIVPATDYLVS